MSDYAQNERRIPQMFRSFMTVLLALAFAFACSGISVTQFAYADNAVDITVKYVDAENNAIADQTDKTVPATLIDGKGTVDINAIKALEEEITGYTFSKITYTDGTATTNVAEDATTIPVQAGTVINIVYDKDENQPVITSVNIPIKYVASGAAIDSVTDEEVSATLTDGEGTVDVSEVDKKTIDGYTFSKITYTDGTTTTNVAEDATTIPVKAGTVINVVYTKNPQSQTQTTTVSAFYVDEKGAPIEDQVAQSIRVELTDGEGTVDVSEVDKKTIDGYTFSKITYTDGTTTTNVAEDATTIPVKAGTVINVVYTKNATEPTTNTINYTVKYVDTSDNNKVLETKNASAQSETDSAIITNSAATINSPEGYSMGLTISVLTDGVTTSFDNGPGKTFVVKDGSVVTVPCTPIPNDEPLEGKWVSSGGRWWYKYTDGTYPANQWLLIDDKYYFFDADGWMKTRWLQTDISIDGTKFTTPVWYYLASGGEMKTGWVHAGRWYYLLPSNNNAAGNGPDTTGTMVASTVMNIGGEYFSFDSSGAMLTGWQKTDNTWSYYNAWGAQVHDQWVKSGADWFWLDSDGLMATSKWVDGDNYYVDAKGVMQTGWTRIGRNSAGDLTIDASTGENAWYFFNSSGAKLTNRWLLSGGKWYWLQADGTMAQSTFVKDDMYYIGSDGVMKTGWVEVSNVWYYFNASGAKVINRWIPSGANWYWMGAEGKMATNSWVDNGNYYVGENGVMLANQWKRIGVNSDGKQTIDLQDQWSYYCFGASGLKAVNQWVKKDDKWYWFGNDGAMVQNAWVDGDKYHVNNEGVYEPNYRADPTQPTT